MSQNTLFIEEPFHLGSWLVHPVNNTLKNGSSEVKIQPKHMEVLTYLCSQNNKIVNSEELIQNCWPNQFISDNPIHKCIAELRKFLGDSPKKPEYISTVPKRGYCIVATISKLRNHQQNIQAFWLDASPFRGSKSYTQEHKEIFFGRSHVVSKVLRLVDQLKTKQAAFLLILGQSGCGKSSLVEAGVIPKLLNPNHPFNNDYTSSVSISVALLDSKDYLSSMLSQFIEHQVLLDNKNIEQYIEKLQSQFGLASDVILRDQESQQLVLFIDQLELLFTQESNSVRLDLIFKLLQSLIDSRAYLLVLALGEEYYLELTRVPSYKKIKDKAITYQVPALSYDDISDIIRKPVQAAGLVYEYKKNSQESLDNLLMNEVQSKNIPLANLQYTLNELYKNRQNKQLTYLAYESMGGIEGGIASIAESTYLELNEAQKDKFDELLHNLIQINPTSRNIVCCKKIRLKSFKDEDIKKVIAVFVNKRLFQTQLLDNRSYIFLAHDSLITDWQRLNKWVVRNMGLLKTKQDLKLASDSWIHNNKDKDFLFRSQTTIKDAQSLLKNKNTSFNFTEKQFLKASDKNNRFRKNIKFGLIFTWVGFSIALVLLTLSIHQKNKQIINTKNNAENLISFILFDLKDKLEPLGRVDLLDLVGSKTIEYFAGVGTKNLSKTSLLNWVQALQIMGESNFAKGDYKAANEIFIKSNDVLEKALINDNLNTTLLETAYLTQYLLGHLAFIKKDFKLAEENLKSYLTVAQNLSKIDPKNNKWKLEISYALNNLGALANKLNQLQEAAGFFKQSIDIKQQLLTENPEDPILIADLADSISWVGKIKEKEGDLQARLEIYQKSLQLTQQLIQLDASNPSWNNRLSMAHHRVALSFYDFGQLQEAKSHLQQSINLLEILVSQDQQNFSIKRELINNYQLMTKINRHQSNFDASLLAIQKANSLIDIFKTNLKYNAKIANYQIHLKIQQAMIMREFKQMDSSLNTIQAGLDLWREHFSSQNADEALLYVSLNLFRKQILNAKDSNLGLGLDNFDELISVLDPHLKSSISNFNILSMYLTLHGDKQFSNKDSYLKKLAESNYRNPDYLNKNQIPLNNNNSITQQEIK
jgi:DNA-binding winged helix-turn-helix (wHTH) protein/energy-coupling factor transporter ATP-binding protein EcfA2